MFRIFIQRGLKWHRLTPNTPLIHTSFTYRKLNMDEICGLKYHLSYVHMYNTKVFIEIHPCAKKLIFYWICNFEHFYDVKNIVLHFVQCFQARIYPCLKKWEYIASLYFHLSEWNSRSCCPSRDEIIVTDTFE